MRQDVASKIRVLVLLTGLITTLIVWTTLADPIGVAKMFMLAIFSTWILGTLISELISAKHRSLSLGQWAVIGFVICIFVAALLTDVKYTAFFGAIQRNDGAISYISLSILAFAAMSSFTDANIGQIRAWLLVVGAFLTLYGMLQTFGHDPLNWVLLYNPIIGTLGNPDFFSGIVGVAAVASVWHVIVEDKGSAKVAGTVLIILELFVLKRCGSIQGIAAFALGLAALAAIKLWQIQRRFGIAFLILGGMTAIPAILGLLNFGPLAKHLYRASFQSRMDYWHAAWAMFRSHPFAGVGLDRFGEYYGQYSPQIQVVQGQPTDNAHNVIFQLLATGGLLVILPYLFLILVIFSRAVRGIRASSGRKQLDTVALFSIWFSLLLVSLISIDNLGVVVWFWISGGILYGATARIPKQGSVSKEGRGKKAKKLSNELNVLSPIISFALSISMLLILVPAWKSSSMLLNIQRHTSGWTEAQFVDQIDQTANSQRGNTPVHIQLADIALRVSAEDLAANLLHSILQQDPRSINGHYLSAGMYEMRKQYQNAVPYRLKLLQIDPWSTRNMLQLVTDYVALKNMAKAREMSSRLSQLYPKSPDAQSAAVLIKG